MGSKQLCLVLGECCRFHLQKEGSEETFFGEKFLLWLVVVLVAVVVAAVVVVVLAVVLGVTVVVLRVLVAENKDAWYLLDHYW